MERPVAQNSGMVVRAERAGVVTSVDATRILVDNADEYVLRKFVGLNERTCLRTKADRQEGPAGQEESDHRRRGGRPSGRTGLGSQRARRDS